MATMHRRRSNQDTVGLDYFEIPAEAAGAEHSVQVRVSRFFPLAMYNLNDWIGSGWFGKFDDTADKLSQETQNKIENALAAFGYDVLKPNSVLFDI